MPYARATLVAAIATLCAIVLMPAAAQAGTYRMYTCQPQGVNIAQPSRSPWRVFNENNSGVRDISNCGSAPGGSLQIDFPGGMAANSFGGLELPAAAATPGVAIARITTRASTDYEGAPYDQAVCPGCANFPFAGSGLGPNGSAYPGGTDEAFTTDFNPPVGSFVMSIHCGDGAMGGGCRPVHSPNLVLAGAVVDLVESVAPSGTITGGGLASTGTKAGTTTLSYTAVDGQSGVARVDAMLDDISVGAVDFSRNVALPLAQQGSGPCSYTQIGACPANEAGDIAVDTTKAAAGAHVVKLRITDAAGNVRDVIGPAVTVSNSAGGAGGADGVAPGAPNGTNASRSAKIAARFAATKKTSYRVKYKGSPTIRGTLNDEKGQPIGGARLVVFTRLKRAGARREQITVITTADNGAFTYRLPAGPSRTVTFSYTAFGGDPKATATKNLKTTVRASIAVRPSARAPRVANPFRLLGKLNYLPRSGVRLLIQARNGRRWQTVDTVKTTRGGRYSWRYRFSPTGRGRTFAFRVRVDSEIYPFAASNSKVVRVRVR
jgi:hypothetical protein